MIVSAKILIATFFDLLMYVKVRQSRKQIMVQACYGVLDSTKKTNETYYPE